MPPPEEARLLQKLTDSLRVHANPLVLVRVLVLVGVTMGAVVIVVIVAVR